MNVVKEIRRLNEREASLSTSLSGSWHEQYKDSAYVFVGGLPYNFTEGDIICVLSQFGEIAGINLVRDKETGQSKGFAFLKYVDQRSTVLAVDNMNGSKVSGRVLRVDHVQNYKVPKVFDDEGNEIEPDEDTVNNAAPKPIEENDSDDESSGASEVDDTGIAIDDPMREYLLNKRRKKEKKAKRKAEKNKDKDDGTPKESKAEKRARKEAKRAAKKEKKEKEKEGKDNDKEGRDKDKDKGVDMDAEKDATIEKKDKDASKEKDSKVSGEARDTSKVGSDATKTGDADKQQQQQEAATREPDSSPSRKPRSRSRSPVSSRSRHHTDRGHDLLVGTAQHPTTTDETEIAIKHEQMTEVAEGTRGNVLADIAAQVETAITMALQPVGEVLHRILVAGIMIVGRDTGVVVPAVVRVDVDLARIVVAVVVEVQDDHEWIVGNAKATRIH
ncbi:hypothetical protein BGX31_000879 [Mortierella sp. GBA43]|nr:hypothetical protein BGX31_000879 [Mortierella sp. GBA43]